MILFQIAYLTIGLVISSYMMVLAEQRDFADDDFERFLLALSLVLACATFWPLVGSAVLIMHIGKWLS